MSPFDTRSGLSRLVAALALAAGAGCATTSPPPAEPAPSDPQAAEIAELEKVFWYCDYVGTTRGVLAAPTAACSYATVELRRKKFGGSFRELLAWWQENKAAEHQRLAREVQ